ncbi:hypothetical protein EDC94DRAFT_618706 [Helicostylum pulchrum]|nr:hypothetical protein EDC94DRAFT_618706 [Helicostylum pulchrum]
MLNKLFGKDEKLNNLRERMKAEGFTEKHKKEPRHKEVFNPLKKIPPANILDETSRSCITNFLSAYPDSYKFQKDSIFYDVAAPPPTNHFKAFYKLAQFFELEKLKKFNCFPLRTTFIPAYITFGILNLEKKAFKNQDVKKSQV